MGLSVVHGIVTGHDGKIIVESKPDKGSRFDIYLPVIEEMVQETPAAKSYVLPPGNERIMFVDDEEWLVDYGKNLFENLGYKVFGETSSVQALEAFKKNPDEFDLIITDQTMPNMSGIELTKKILEIRPDIPIILCTGYSKEISPSRIKEIGIKL